jgi:hypothetical protein
LQWEGRWCGAATEGGGMRTRLHWAWPGARLGLQVLVRRADVVDTPLQLANLILAFTKDRPLRPDLAVALIDDAVPALYSPIEEARVGV